MVATVFVVAGLPCGQVKALLSNRRLPQHGWDEVTIQLLLQVGEWVSSAEQQLSSSFTSSKAGWQDSQPC